MLQNVKTKKYYKRRGGWVFREEAAVWTSRQGPVSAKGSRWGAAGQDSVIREFEIEDDTDG
jgi:hypothetical protein